MVCPCQALQDRANEPQQLAKFIELTSYMFKELYANEIAFFFLRESQVLTEEQSTWVKNTMSLVYKVSSSLPNMSDNLFLLPKYHFMNRK